MPLITMNVSSFIPANLVARASVNVTGAVTPLGAVTNIQVLTAATVSNTTGSISANKIARVLTTFAKHDQLIADLKSGNTVVVTLTTDNLNTNKIVNFSSRQTPAGASAGVAFAVETDNLGSDSAIPI